MGIFDKDPAYYLKSRYTKKKALFACRALAKIGQLRYLKRARSNNKKGFFPRYYC